MFVYEVVISRIKTYGGRAASVAQRRGACGRKTALTHQVSGLFASQSARYGFTPYRSAPFQREFFLLVSLPLSHNVSLVILILNMKRPPMSSKCPELILSGIIFTLNFKRLVLLILIFVNSFSTFNQINPFEQCAFFQNHSSR